MTLSQQRRLEQNLFQLRAVELNLAALAEEGVTGLGGVRAALDRVVEGLEEFEERKVA